MFFYIFSKLMLSIQNLYNNSIAPFYFYIESEDKMQTFFKRPTLILDVFKTYYKVLSQFVQIVCTYIYIHTSCNHWWGRGRDFWELSDLRSVRAQSQAVPTLEEMRQGGTFETRAAHNKSHHRCGRRPGSSGLASAREAAPRGAQRDRSEGPENRGPGPRRPRRRRRRWWQRRRWGVRRQRSPRSTGLTGAANDRDRETVSVQPAAHRALTTTTRSRSLFQAWPRRGCGDAHYHMRWTAIGGD